MFHMKHLPPFFSEVRGVCYCFCFSVYTYALKGKVLHIILKKFQIHFSPQDKSDESFHIQIMELHNAVAGEDIPCPFKF